MLDVTPKIQKSRTQALTGRTPRATDQNLAHRRDYKHLQRPKRHQNCGHTGALLLMWPRMGRKSRLRRSTPLHQTPCHVDQTGLYTARPRLFPSRSDLFCIRRCLFSSTGARRKAGIKRNDDNLWRALRWTRLKTQSSWTAPTSWTNHEQI